LGWFFDGARRCIELPAAKLDSAITEIKMILRQSTIQYKRFEILVWWMRYAVIGLPAGRELCAPFNNTVSIHPKMVALGKHRLVFKAFDNWRRFLIDMRKRPTYVNELVVQDIADVGNMDASGIGARVCVDEHNM